MSSLKDALQISGLVNDKKRRKLEHEQRAKKKQQASPPQVQGEAPAPDPAKERLLRLARIIDDGRLDDSEGRKRFHFVARDGRIPFLNVNDVVNIRLQRGVLAIVEDLQGQPAVISRDAAIKLLSEEPSLVRFFLKGGGARSE